MRRCGREGDGTNKLFERRVEEDLEFLEIGSLVEDPLEDPRFHEEEIEIQRLPFTRAIDDHLE